MTLPHSSGFSANTTVISWNTAALIAAGKKFSADRILNSLAESRRRRIKCEGHLLAAKIRLGHQKHWHCGRGNSCLRMSTNKLEQAVVPCEVLSVLFLVKGEMKKKRLDLVLVERALYPSREQARRAIMAGEVKLEHSIADKPSLLVDPNVSIATAEPPRFVSRGGLKLEGALNFFKLSVEDKVAIDIGASTGGFTDCLLQGGAAKVYAIDVGRGQLAWKIRTDPRVIVFEKTNARSLSSSVLHELVDICVIDVSFISLTLILPEAFTMLRSKGVVLALIKPQFELSRGEVARGGVVRESALHSKSQRKIVTFIEELGYHVVGTVPSVITGADGNQEFFICAEKQSR